MLNRIRISTTLFLILILCGVLQVGSNGLSFWAFRDGYQNLQEVETSNQQRSALAQTRAVLLQASTALNKAGTLTALSYPPDEVRSIVGDVKQNLSQADALFQGFMALPLMGEHDKELKAFTAQEAVSEKQKALNVAMKKNFDVWYGDLDHQATWLENNQLSDFLIHFECGDAKLFLYKGSNYGFHITPFITYWALSAARHSLFKRNQFLTA